MFDAGSPNGDGTESQEDITFEVHLHPNAVDKYWHIYNYGIIAIIDQPIHGSLEDYTAYGGSVGYTANPSFHQGIDRFKLAWRTFEGTVTRNYLVKIIDYRPPSLVNPGQQSSSGGESPVLELSATEPNGNELTYYATGLPPGLSLSPAYGKVTGSIEPYAANGSPYRVTIGAWNRYVATIQSFDWIVTPAVPSIDNAGDSLWDGVNNAERDPVSIAVRASDPGGLALTYTAAELPPGLAINSTTGLISGTVAAGSRTSSPYNTKISVSNGSKTSLLEFP